MAEQQQSEQPEGQSPPDSQPSFDDRLARLMGITDDAPEEEEQEEEVADFPDAETGEQPEGEPQAAAEDSQFEEVEYEGKTYQVPAEIKSALMRNADYTQKTQELAEMRRQTELQAQSSIAEKQFQQYVSEDVNRLSILDAAIAEYSQSNWAQMDTDQLVRTRMALENLKEQRQQVAATVEGKRQQFISHLANLSSEMAQRGAEYLQKHIPGWSEQVQNEVKQFALSRFSPGELQNIYDPRLVQTLWEANEYRKIKAQTSETLTKARKAPPAVRPGSSRPMPGKTAQYLNYRKALSSAKTPAQREAVIQQRVAQKLFGR